MKKITLLISCLLLAFSTQNCSDEASKEMKIASLERQYGLKRLSQAQVSRLRGNILNFNSAEEAEAFLQKVNYLPGSVKRTGRVKVYTGRKLKVTLNRSKETTRALNLRIADDDGGLETLSVKVNPFASLKVDMSYTENEDGTYSIDDLSAGLTGLTIGTALNTTAKSSKYNCDTGNIEFTIAGDLEHNLFIEGIGTIYTRSVTISGTFNPTTGDYTLTWE